LQADALGANCRVNTSSTTRRVTDLRYDAIKTVRENTSHLTDNNFIQRILYFDTY